MAGTTVRARGRTDRRVGPESHPVLAHGNTLRGPAPRAGRWRQTSLTASAPRQPGSVGVFPVHARGVGPQVLDGVVFARVRVEDVDDHVAVILHDPFAGLVALDGPAPVAALVQGGIHLFADRVDLAAAGAGG